LIFRHANLILFISSPPNSWNSIKQPGPQALVIRAVAHCFVLVDPHCEAMRCSRPIDSQIRTARLRIWPPGSHRHECDVQDSCALQRVIKRESHTIQRKEINHYACETSSDRAPPDCSGASCGSRQASSPSRRTPRGERTRKGQGARGDGA